jgi:dTDP-4-dehydrorhamnose reductase
MREGPWLVLGGSGLIGWNCVRALRVRGLPAVATSLSPRDGFVHADIADEAGCAELIRDVDPSAVVVCAAATWADRCELEPEWAMALNVTAFERLLPGVRPDTVLVSISSDCVFDGTAGPYREEDAVAPINQYGRTKMAGERVVARHPEHLVIRTTVVYGAELRDPGKNSMCQLRDALESGRKFPAPVDEIATPTSGSDLGDAIVELVVAGARGVLHACGPELVSRYEYARLAAAALELDPDLVVPALSDEMGRPARRPKRSGLISTKAEAAMGRSFLGLSEGLAAAISDWDETRLGPEIPMREFHRA